MPPINLFKYLRIILDVNGCHIFLYLLFGVARAVQYLYLLITSVHMSLSFAEFLY